MNSSMVLLKPDRVTILQVLIKGAYSVEQISKITLIPTATCYRIVKKLFDAELVSYTKKLTGSVYTKIYRSTKSKYHIQITGKM